MTRRKYLCVVYEVHATVFSPAIEQKVTRRDKGEGNETGIMSYHTMHDERIKFERTV
jgi:hypothetical protein